MRTLLFTILLLASAAQAGEFKAGAASVVITPKVGTPMAGYYNFRAATGVLDDLYAKALVVEQDGAKAAFVTLDLITGAVRTFGQSADGGRPGRTPLHRRAV
jgi:hypothetical protein